MTLNIKNIIEFIRQNKLTYITLKLMSDYNNSANIGRWNCDSCSLNASYDEKIEKTIDWLESYVGMFPPKAIFLFIGKPTAKSNQDTVIGPIKFTFSTSEHLYDDNLGSFQQQQQPINIQSEVQQLGYVPHQQVEAALLKKELEHQKELNNLTLEQIKKDFKASNEAILQQANVWNPERMTQLAQELGMLFGVVTGKINPEILAGIPNKQTETQQQQNILLTRLEKEIETFDLNDQEKIYKTFFTFINNQKKNFENSKTNLSEQDDNNNVDSDNNINI